jgi:hypothetical protein
VAGALAYSTWHKKEEPVKQQTYEVEVWRGSPDNVSRISFDSPGRKVLLEARKDETGRFFVGTVDREASPPPKGPPGARLKSEPEPTGVSKRETVRFVAVSEAQKLAESVAPLKALRRIGRVDNKRASEFGLDKPEGTMKIQIGDNQHVLVIGSAAPGGGDRYAKEMGTGETYAISTEVANRVMYAETRLLERNLHGWENDRVKRVEVARGQKKRELVPVEGKLGGWGDASTPTKLDETAGNWMSKLGRVHVADYTEAPPGGLGPADLVVRVDYFEKSRSKSIGFVEIFRKGTDKEREYYGRTEHTRWPFKVLKSVGEQIDQDLPSVVR